MFVERHIPFLILQKNGYKNIHKIQVFKFVLGCNINLDATYLVFKQKGHNSLS